MKPKTTADSLYISKYLLEVLELKKKHDSPLTVNKFKK